MSQPLIPVPEEPDRLIHWSRYLIGCALLGAAIFFGVWGFRLGTLTPDQRRILVWILPLSSGFACYAFSGQLNVRFKSPLPGLFIAATGGFGIWALSFFYLFPSSKVVQERSPAEQTVLNLKHQITDVRGKFEAIGDYPANVQEVRTTAPALGAALGRIADGQLDELHQIVKYEYMGYAYVMAAYVERDSNSGTFRDEWAGAAATAYSEALNRITSVFGAEADGDEGAREAADWLRQDQEDARCTYGRALALGILARYHRDRLPDAINTFHSINPGYKERYVPSANMIFAWLESQDGGAK